MAQLASFLFYLGFLIAFIGVVMLIIHIIKNAKNPQTKVFSEKKEEKKSEIAKEKSSPTSYEKSFESRLNASNATIYDKLEQIKLGNMIVHWQENYQVTGKIKLIEMTWDENDQRIATGQFFPIVVMDKSRYLVSMPKGEGAEIIWFFLERKDTETALTPFFLGTDGNIGAATQFADSEQTAEVFFRLPQKNMGEIQWQMKDIGSFFFESDGRAFLSGKGETRHILARDTHNPKQYLLYFDLLEGKGSSCLLIGNEINPESEIEYVL